MRGNPTRLAPIPNPAPERALTAIDGTYVSNIENVASFAKFMLFFYEISVVTIYVLLS